MVIKHVEIPDRDDVAHSTDEHTLHATDIWQIVQKSVAWAGYDFLVTIHFDRDIHLHIEVFFIWFNWELLDFEDWCIS